jgi:soluble lytic murein transglycosylase
MTRTRLAILIVSALLTTGIHPFAAMSPDADPSHEAYVSERHRLDSPLAARNPSVRLTSEDRILAAGISLRLSHRHTGLPVHERLRLAQTIVSEARAQKLDPELVIAVIEVESAGYPLAVSQVGAMGLMQLLPSTAEEVAQKLGIEWKGDDTLFDPIINIKLGTAYLRELANRYDDVDVALAAYNWGPGRIDRRIRRGATIPSKYIEQVRHAYERQTIAASRAS